MKNGLVFGLAGVSIVAVVIAACLGVLRAQAQSQGAVIAPEACMRDFHDDFRVLDVTAKGPGSRWIAHTPWFGDFGDAQFTDPSPTFPFQSGANGLTITAEKDAAGKWRSGLLSSTDPQGHGFAATYGYFELVAKLPRGKGTWPAFWLLTADRNANPDIEIDVYEYYGHWRNRFQSTVTVRPKGGAKGNSATRWIDTAEGALEDGFHRYGVDVGKTDVIFFLDRREVWRTPTPKAHTKPLGILFNLALGSGWPIAETPNPSKMQITEVSHYKDTEACIRQVR